MIGQTLVFSNKKLTRFPDIPGKTIIEKLDLSNNKIVDFSGIKSYQKLKQLVLDFNPKFSSFRGIENFILPELNDENKITTLNSLTNFSCQKTPLGNSPNIVLMATIIFGNNLKYVNGITISSSVYKLASSLRNDIFDLLINGWIITSTNPIRILNVDSRKRKIIYPQKGSSNTQTHKKKEKSNNYVETSSGAIDVYLEPDDDSSNGENSDQEYSNSTNVKSRSPKKGYKNSQEDNQSLINGLIQNPNQELLNMKLAEKQEKWHKKKEILQRGVAANHDNKSKEKVQKQKNNNEEEDEEEEIDEKEKKELEKLRKQFNVIHDQFLNTIGPIFNNNNEYIVYNTTPGSPSQSRLGRTRSQAANYSPAQSPRNGTRSQAANYSSNQSPRSNTRSQAANYSSTQSPRDRSRSQAANYSPNKTQTNSTEKITTGTPMKMLIRNREERNVSVKKESPFPRNDFFTQQKAKKAPKKKFKEEVYEENLENQDEYGQEEINDHEESENPDEYVQEEINDQEEPENPDEYVQDEINDQEEPENPDEYVQEEINTQEEPENLDGYVQDEINTQEEPENLDGYVQDEINTQEEPENQDGLENLDEFANQGGIENQEGLENQEELENPEEIYNQDGLENAVKTTNTDGKYTDEQDDSFTKLYHNENLGEVDTIDAILNDNDDAILNDNDDDELGLGDSLLNIINQNGNASGSDNLNLE